MRERILKRKNGFARADETEKRMRERILKRKSGCLADGGFQIVDDVFAGLGENPVRREFFGQL